MSLPFPYDNPRLYDRFEIGADVLPGSTSVTVSGPVKVDEVPAPGTDGGATVYKGRPLCRFTTVTRVHDDAGWQEMQRLFLVLRPVVPVFVPHAVYHPMLELFGVTKAVVSDPKQPVFEKGIWTLEVSWIEYRKLVVKSLPRPAAAKQGLGAVDSAYQPPPVVAGVNSGAAQTPEQQAAAAKLAFDAKRAQENAKADVLWRQSMGLPPEAPPGPSKGGIKP